MDDDGFSDVESVTGDGLGSAQLVVAGSRLNPSETMPISSIRCATSREKRALALMKMSSSPQPVQPPKWSKTDWVEVFRRNNWTTFHHFTMALAARNADARSLASSIRTKDSLKKQITEILNRVTMLEVSMSYRDRLHMFPVSRSTVCPETKRVANCIWRILCRNVEVCNEDIPYECQGCPHSAQRCWFLIAYMARILFDKCGKRRSLMFYGTPSSGKSLLASVISACVPDNLIGRLTMQGARSTFWFQSLLCKSLYIAEEISLCDQTAQAFKLLLEGSRSLTTDVKFADHVAIEYRPVIVTSNDPCYVNVNREQGAFRERGLELRFINQVATTCSRERKHQAEAWALLTMEALARFPESNTRELCDDDLLF